MIEVYRAKRGLMLIGITGTNSSGKETVAEYLIKKGFAHFSLSDELREIAKERGSDTTRETLIALGNELRKKYGEGELAKRVLKKIQGKAVVSSIRNLGEIKELKKQKNFILVNVDAKPQIRFKRAQKRNRLGDTKTLKEFIAQEERENSQNKFAQQLSLCQKEADYIINNNGTLKELYAQIEKILRTLSVQKTIMG